jgi:hypothetical protein
MEVSESVEKQGDGFVCRQLGDFEHLARILAVFPCTTMPGTWDHSRLSYLQRPDLGSDAWTQVEQSLIDIT